MRKYLWTASLGCLLLLFLSACQRDSLRLHKEWATYFEDNDVEGSAMIHSFREGTFDIYNMADVQKRFVPAETFQLVLTLAGLETGVIKDTTSPLTLPDSLDDAHLSKQSLSQAFRTNDIPYFQEVAQQIGTSRMSYWLDSTYYGNRAVGSSMKDFWLNNALQISSDEQMGLLEELYMGKLTFQTRSQRLLKGLMIKRVTHGDTLRFQSGVGKIEDQQIGWLVGYLLKKDHPYFFTIRTQAADSIPNLNDRNKNILNKILEEVGLKDETWNFN